MAGTLTVSPSDAPFPYAAVAIAAYTQKAEVVYEPGVTAELHLDGSRTTEQDEMLTQIAKGTDLLSESSKVSAPAV